MRKKILILDDEWAMLELLRIHLSGKDFEVFMSQSPEEFKALALRHKPDMMMMDIVVGDKNGPDVYQEMLQNGFDPKIPVVFMSSLANDRPYTPPQKDHRYSLIGKPFNVEQLTDQLRELAAV